jgi:nicotinate-nucleotide adenylyltransferase
MKVGIMGGTFDPVHSGHLIVAEEVREVLGLAKVLFMPCGQPWLKLEHPITPAVHRVEMVRLAIGTAPQFKLSEVEVKRSGPSYSVDTMVEFQKQLGAGTELFFIVGCDALVHLARWKEPQRLIQLCKLVAVPRLNFNSPDLKALERSVPGVSERLIYVAAPIIDISSSRIRERVRKGLSIRYLVPGKVEEYIARQKLYAAF